MAYLISPKAPASPAYAPASRKKSKQSKTLRKGKWSIFWLSILGIKTLLVSVCVSLNTKAYSSKFSEGTTGDETKVLCFYKEKSLICKIYFIHTKESWH